jgi:hemerythrin-like domain-containing protein
VPDTLFLLRLEHGNLAQLLGLIEDQVAAAEAGNPMDLELLRLASEYFSDYPDRYHHPKEDLVYQRLSERDPDARLGIRNLLEDHRRLHELTEQFAGAVQQLREGPQAAEAGAREVVREFAERYRQHMREEDERFFPLALKRLTKADWDDLDFTIFEQDDPLFDHVAEERFSDLRNRLEALVERSKSRQSALEAAHELRRLTGVESFNDGMEAAGQPFRLARFAEGGYGIERDSKLLLYIPACPEEQAAWCAYAYLRGLAGSRLPLNPSSGR